MPKEAIHLFLAQRCREAAASGSSEGKFDFNTTSLIIESAPHLFSMGSVAPDSIYNYISGPAKEYLKKHLDHSHGGEASGLFDYLLRFAALELPLIPSLSFGLGILCHLTADMIFHPMVFHFCGKDVTGGESESTVRHYQFESDLDRILRWIHPEQKAEHLASHLKRKELSNPDFARALKSLHLPTEEFKRVPDKEFLSMYRQHALFEGFYGNVFFKYLARLINKASRGAKPTFPALFYSNKTGKARSEEGQLIFDRRFSYQNPVTGAVLEKSVNEMIDDSRTLFFEYLRPLEAALKPTGLIPENHSHFLNPGPDNQKIWEEIIPVFNSWNPRSPKTGLPTTQDGKMRFFNIRTFEELLKISK